MPDVEILDQVFLVFSVSPSNFKVILILTTRTTEPSPFSIFEDSRLEWVNVLVHTEGISWAAICYMNSTKHGCHKIRYTV